MGDQRNVTGMNADVVNRPPAAPRPIHEALRAFVEQSEPQIRLQRLCLSLIPMTFQYLALVLSSEYLQAGSPRTRTPRTAFWRWCGGPAGQVGGLHPGSHEVLLRESDEGVV